MKKINFNNLFFKSVLELKKKNLNRDLRSLKRINSIKIRYKNKTLLNFSSNDYLGLSQNIFIKNNTIKIIKKYGIGSGSSRLVSGNFDLHETIEKDLAKKKKTESSLIFSTGYLVNYSVLSTILNSNLFKNPIVFSDKLNHQCIYEGCNNKKINFIRYRHNDMDHLEYMLKKNKNKNNAKFILSETIFSMDGDFADIKNLIFLKKKYNSFLFLDEAHATGIYGKNGFGLSSEFSSSIDCVTGTFSKALGSFGAYIACSNKLKSFLINKCPSFIYSTSLPFSLLASIHSAIKIIPKLNNERKKLIKNSFYFRKILKNNNFNIGSSQTHIIPIIIGDPLQTIKISQKLENDGFYIVSIRPPTVTLNSSRLRLSLSSLHTKKNIKDLFNSLKLIKESF